MKFGKEFVSQMIPEWQPAYMDYDSLKTLNKEIQRFRTRNADPHRTGVGGGPIRYRTFSGLIPGKPSRGCPLGGSAEDMESQTVILVDRVEREGAPACETTFLMAAGEGGEYELRFFRRLDEEFNKVEKFYREKVGEVMKEAEMLNKQMDALIAFGIKVESPGGLEPIRDGTVEMTRIASGIDASRSALAASTPSGGARKRSFRAERSDEEDEVGDSGERATQESSRKQKPSHIRGVRPARIEILDRVRINKTLETPRSTIKGLLRVANQAELKFSRKNLSDVEEKLRLAFVEFYQKLRLLKSYSFLNTLAFSKIMKKYDKIASRNAAEPYMKMVENSYLRSSDEVTKLMERVEATFIKHFANSNRSKGMSILRPKKKRERHRITFSTGFGAGCTFSLIVALALINHTHELLDKKGQDQYMNSIFPLYSFFGFVVLHMLMYAANIYFWKRYHVNYSFIFGFKQGTELGYREVLLLAFGLGAFALACVLCNLVMEMNRETEEYTAITELLPLFLLLALILIMILPFNILFRSSRYFFLACLLRCAAAPLYKVTLPDFFLSDQLTSQVQAIRSLEFFICYYTWGDYKLREVTKCKDSEVYKTFLYIVAAIPYASRFLQCLRRLLEEKNMDHGFNGLKYFLTVAAVCLRTAYSLGKGEVWNVSAWVFSAIAAIFCTYWDFVHDWGLLNRRSKNPWLRDKLLVPHKMVYFIAMGLNVALRFAWLQTVLDFNFSFMHRQATIAAVACLEIIRRGIWNFFRLENEHLNNVGKFRAFKSVPLPFNYDEEDDKDD